MASDWILEYEGYDPDQEGLREALCTLGNGCFATRGAAPEAEADGVHYPGTYLAGGYDRARSEVSGRTVENEDLVNLPNWLALAVRPEGGDWMSPDAHEVLAYRQRLHMDRGVLERVLTLRDGEGRETRLEEERLVHMGRPHLAALRLRVTPRNWSGTLEVRSALDGRVINSGVERYRDLEGRHLEPLDTEAFGEDGVLLQVRTLQSRIEVAQAARLRVLRDGSGVPVEPRVHREPGFIRQDLGVEVTAGEPVEIEKLLALCTSRDKAISESALEAQKTALRLGGYADLLRQHELIWDQLWKRFDLVLALDQDEEDRRETQCTLRLHVFHLLQTASPHTMDLDAGVPARGLHGEAYRGHIFWDELFVFPLLNLRLPEITRGLLMYRFRRLDEARAAAREAGYDGAMFPWQSGSDGREESQTLHLNPESGRWVPDPTHLQRHVGSAIAYNVWQYYQVTRDRELLSFHGAEMILEVARFWASMARYNQEMDRYEIKGVIGPDEFQTAYPDADEPGLDNHAYTNLMAVWVWTTALDLPRHLPGERWDELREMLRIDDEELEHWDRLSRRMRLCFHDDGILSQFEGYERLEELDWEGYRERYGDISRLDRILEAEGDTPNRYKASKQADVLMLFYLFSTEVLETLFERLGYPFDPGMIPRTIDHYLRRTTHGSTLSRVVHAWVLARSDRPRSWGQFLQALKSDVADVQGGTTPEGIHLGAMAGTVDLIQRGYTGIEVRGDCLWLDPCLPEEVKSLDLCLRYRGCTLDLAISGERLVVEVRADESVEIPVRVAGRDGTLRGGERREFPLESG